MAEGGRLREWTAQYQQEPAPDEGTYILAKWFEDKYAALPKDLKIYMVSDFAVTDPDEGQEPDYTEHGVFGVDAESNILPLAWWSGRTTSDVWIEKLLDLVSRYKPLCWFGEAGQIRRAIEPFLKKRCKERGVFFRQEWIAPIKDKAIKGRAFQARASMGKVKFPVSEQWAEEVIEQCVGFPGVRFDDKFDVMSMICSVVDKAHPAIVQTKKPPPKPRDRYKPARRRRKGRSWKTA
jgi:predicted phage terminase large subunit-like protein